MVEVGNRENSGALKARSIELPGRFASPQIFLSHEWACLQFHYATLDREAHACAGYELAKAVTGVFKEVMPAMNCCMQIRLECGGLP